jgi:subtilisin family serine protease
MTTTRRSAVLVAVFCLLALPVGALSPAGPDIVRPAPTSGSDAAFVPGEVLVRFRPEMDAGKADPLAADLGFSRVEHAGELDVTKYRVAGDVAAAVDSLRRRTDVLFAEPNYLVSPATVPNDGLYANVNGEPTDLQRWTFGGVPGNGSVGAEAAWDVTTGRPDVTIAVVDTGVKLGAGDLAVNAWTNPGEVPGNGLDDDRNGYVDDFNGWDFYSGDADPSPDLGNGRDDDGAEGPDSNVFHGTFVASCAAGRGNDGHGVCGASWDCRVMPIKIFTDDGVSDSFQIALAITYAASNGADVVNLSLTVGVSSETLRQAVAYALARDCVVVGAAGNFNNSQPFYPAAYDGVLSVGASDHAFTGSFFVRAWGPGDIDGRAPYSEYGPNAVDVVAPGTVFNAGVISVADAAADSDLKPGLLVGFSAGGTSFAAPIVSGLAALMISRDKDLNGGVRTLRAAEIVDIVERTARDLGDDPFDNPNAGASWDGHGRVDFPSAVAAVVAREQRPYRLSWRLPAGANGAPTALLVDAGRGVVPAPGAGFPAWSASTVTGYRIYRASTPNVALTPANRIGEVAANQLWFLDSSPTPGAHYVVTAIHGALESAASNEVSSAATAPQGPSVTEPSFKNGKLVLRAGGSGIATGARLVVNGAFVFPLTVSKNGALWVVKKNARSQPGGASINEALPAGALGSLRVVNPDGARSAEVTVFRQ